jgi:hypothetical protein
VLQTGLPIALAYLTGIVPETQVKALLDGVTAANALVS